MYSMKPFHEKRNTILKKKELGILATYLVYIVIDLEEFNIFLYKKLNFKTFWLHCQSSENKFGI